MKLKNAFMSVRMNLANKCMERSSIFAAKLSESSGNEWIKNLNKTTLWMKRGLMLADKESRKKVCNMLKNALRSDGVTF